MTQRSMIKVWTVDRWLVDELLFCMIDVLVFTLQYRHDNVNAMCSSKDVDGF